MDTDVSHAVEERLAAIEARLDALDGGPEQPEQQDEEDEEESDEEPAQPTYTAPTRRGRKPQTTTVESTPDNTETLSTSETEY